MGNYYIDELNYLHYCGDGWVRTKNPLTEEQIALWKSDKIDFENFEWI